MTHEANAPLPLPCHCTTISDLRKLIRFMRGSNIVGSEDWFSRPVETSLKLENASLQVETTTSATYFLPWPCILIWPWTINFTYRHGHDEPSCLISRFKVISFEIYCPNTQTHRQTHRPAQHNRQIALYAAINVFSKYLMLLYWEFLQSSANR